MEPNGPKSNTMKTEPGDSDDIELALHRLDKLIQKLCKHKCEVAVLLVEERTSLSHVRGSEKGLSFLNSHETLETDFLQFCNDEIRKGSADQVTVKVENEVGGDEKDDAEASGHDSDATEDVVISDFNISDDDDDAEKQEESTDITEQNVATSSKDAAEDAADITDKTHSKEAVTLDSQCDKGKGKKNKRKPKTKQEKSGSDQGSKQTIIGHLKEIIQKRANIPTNEALPNSDSYGQYIEESTSTIKSVISFYDDLRNKKGDKWFGKNSGKCFMCHKKVLKAQIESHKQSHIESLEAKVVPCKKCDLLLPELYMKHHNCDKGTALKRIPKDVISFDGEIWGIIALIESQYSFKGFTNSIPCVKCGIKLKYLRHSREHLVRQHLKAYHCELCSKVVDGYPQIMKHMGEHALGENEFMKRSADNDGWMCGSCDMTFVKRKSLLDHIKKIHMDIKPILYPCVLCKRKFLTKEKMERHYKFHKEQLTCNIGECHASFTSSTDLLKHKQSTHKDVFFEKQKFLCSLCGQAFNRRTTLNTHMQWKHDSGNPVTCTVCNKVCRNKASWRCHMKNTHQDRPERQCEYCGKTYTHRSSLWKHKERRHSKHNETYTCEVCGKVFKTHRHFIHHIISLSHLTANQKVKKESIHSCLYCEKQFGMKDKLDAHVSAVHLQNKRHKCEVCDKSFADKSNWRAHMKIHLGSKPFCGVCKISFRSDVKLRQHNAEYHGKREMKDNQTTVTTSMLNNHIPQSHTMVTQAMMNNHFKDNQMPVNTSMLNTHIKQSPLVTTGMLNQQIKDSPTVVTQAMLNSHIKESPTPVTSAMISIHELEPMKGRPLGVNTFTHHPYYGPL